MKPKPRPPADVDAYIASFPPEVRKVLKRIRTTIRKAAPGASEAIKYQIPTFVLNGNLISFAAYQNHIGLYPAPRGSAEFKDELAAYEGGKGTVQFPLDRPIPYGLITGITKFRVKANAKKAVMKRKRR